MSEHDAPTRSIDDVIIGMPWLSGSNPKPIRGDAAVVRDERRRSHRRRQSRRRSDTAIITPAPGLSRRNTSARRCRAESRRTRRSAPRRGTRGTCRRARGAVGNARGVTVPRCSLLARRLATMPPSAPVYSRNGRHQDRAAPGTATKRLEPLLDDEPGDDVISTGERAGSAGLHDDPTQIGSCVRHAVDDADEREATARIGAMQRRARCRGRRGTPRCTAPAASRCRRRR